MNEHIVIPALLGTVLVGTFRQQMLTAWEQLRSRRYGIYLSVFVILVPGLYYAPIDRIVAWWLLVALLLTSSLVWAYEITWKSVLSALTHSGMYWFWITYVLVLGLIAYGFYSQSYGEAISGIGGGIVIGVYVYQGEILRFLRSPFT